jgi:hypothetical protein
MAKKVQSTTNEQRYFDIVPPNRKMPQPTSRPVIVSNRPEQTDPMVKNTTPDITEHNIDSDSEQPPTDEKLPEDITIDNETSDQAADLEPLPEDDKSTPEPPPPLTEDIEPSTDSNEPLLPAHASPDMPAATVSIQPIAATKKHRLLWIAGIIVALLIVIAAIYYVAHLLYY